MATSLDAPKTAEQLRAWINSNFDMKLNYVAAFYDYTDANGTKTRRGFTNLVYGVKNAEPEGQEEGCVAGLWSELVAWLDATGQVRPKMYVRRPLVLEVTQEPVWGDGFVKVSAIEDGTAQLPVGWALDVAAQMWRPVLRTERKTILSIRCNVPDAAPSAT